MRGLFWDLETTSLDTSKARIIQIAASLYDLEKRHELEHFSCLVYDNSYGEISQETTELTGITTQQLEEFGCTPLYAFEQFFRLAKTAEYWIAHNGHNYDLKVLPKELERYNLGMKGTVNHVDTRFDLPYPSHIITRKLTYLAAEHGFVTYKAHGARHDVDSMVKLFYLYPLEPTLERCKSPFRWIRADVTFEKKDQAKGLGYLWDSQNKLWVKLIRECDVKTEKEKAQDKFRILLLDDSYSLPSGT